MMSRGQKIGSLIGIAVALAVAAVAVSAAARFYFGDASQDQAKVACREHGAEHRVVIHEGRLSAQSVQAQRCDTLVIINQDAAKRRLAFGEHSHHAAYDGADGRLIGKGESLSVVLSQTGEFTFHDHFDEAVHGHFSGQKAYLLKSSYVPERRSPWRACRLQEPLPPSIVVGHVQPEELPLSCW